MKQYFKDYKRAARRYLNSKRSAEPPDSLPTWTTLELIERVEALENAIKKFVRAYNGNKAAQLGGGQARRSLNEFRGLLDNEEES